MWQRSYCALHNHPNFSYYFMPVTGGNEIPKSVDEVSKSYINMVDEQMEKIIDLIWNAKTNVLYFCNAGKDRTGVVSAILLYKLGIDMEYIIKDYMKLKPNLQIVLNQYAEQYPEMNIEVIIPREKYMKEFMEWLCMNKG